MKLNKKAFKPYIDPIGRQPITVSLPNEDYIALKQFCNEYDIKMSGAVAQMIRHCFQVMVKP